MKIAYITHVDVRGTRAHVHNTLKTCEALAMAGVDLHLMSLDKAPSQEEWNAIRERHGLVQPFKMTFTGAVPNGDLIQPSRLGRLLALIRLNTGLAWLIWKRRREIDIVYYRYHLLLLPALVSRFLLGKGVIFECHYVYIYDWLPQALTTLAVRSARGVVAITDALRKHYRLSDARSLMAPCHAAELERVPVGDTGAFRKDLDIPVGKTILCYTGSIGATIQGISYEVETMVDVLPKLPLDTVSVIIGAREEKDAQALRERAEKLGVSDRVIIRPWTDRATVMKYLVASDVLVMPRVGTAPGSSPSKMFDYLAIGKPIVAATTPPVAEILQDGRNALLVDADKPEQWPEAIQRVLSDEPLRQRLAKTAREDANSYTWTARGKRIKEFIEKLCG